MAHPSLVNSHLANSSLAHLSLKKPSSIRQTIACIRFLGFTSASVKTTKSSSEAVQKLAEACIRFTPQIAIKPKEAVFLELSKSSHLFSEPTLRARISVLARRLGIEVHITFGSSLCTSLAQSYFPDYEKTQSFSALPIETCFYFLDPFQNNPDDKKKALVLAKTLKLLGVHTLEQFIQLPVESLGSRFGEVATRVHAFATGKSGPPWKGFFPSSIIQETADLEADETEIGLDSLLFTLKILMDRALTRLVGLGQRASRILITLQQVPWSSEPRPKRNWEVSLPIAQATSRGLLPILQERLSYEFTQSPLHAPAQSLKFEILETVPGHGAQRDFFHSKEVQSENWDQLLGRLLSQLGENHVFYADLNESYCPERSWKKSLIPALPLNPLLSPLNSMKLAAFRRRPTRVLKAPEPIQVQAGQIIHLKTGKTWKVSLWEGPERISTDWWRESFLDSVYRDYYRITTMDNGKLWVFFDRSISPAECFLHGYFD